MNAQPFKKVWKPLWYQSESYERMMLAVQPADIWWARESRERGVPRSHYQVLENLYDLSVAEFQCVHTFPGILLHPATSYHMFRDSNIWDDNQHLGLITGVWSARMRFTMHSSYSCQQQKGIGPWALFFLSCPTPPIVHCVMWHCRTWDEIFKQRLSNVLEKKAFDMLVALFPLAAWYAKHYFL